MAPGVDMVKEEPDMRLETEVASRLGEQAPCAPSWLSRSMIGMASSVVRAWPICVSFERP